MCQYGPTYNTLILIQYSDGVISNKNAQGNTARKMYDVFPHYTYKPLSYCLTIKTISAVSKMHFVAVTMAM